MIVTKPRFIAYEYDFLVNLKLQPHHLSVVTRHPYPVYKSLVVSVNGYYVFTGDKILGISRAPRAGERFGALLYVKSVNGMDPGLSKRRPNFVAYVS